MDIIARRPGPSVQEVFEGDTNPPPPVLCEESPAQGQSTADVSAERYFSKAWHDREVDKVWRKCWQLACRVEHIPNIGDHVIYEIVHDSLIVIRTGPDEIRAYVNSCLHRGTLLRTEGGCVNQLRCPFHGWTWKLDGTLAIIPGQWDFPHADKTRLSLPEAQVGTWGGFVFVNFDADCEPLVDSWQMSIASEQQISDVAQAQREADVHHHHHQADDLGRRVETAERVGVGRPSRAHPAAMPASPRPRPFCPDSNPLAILRSSHHRRAGWCQ